MPETVDSLEAPTEPVTAELVEPIEAAEPVPPPAEPIQQRR